MLGHISSWYSSSTWDLQLTRSILPDCVLGITSILSLDLFSESTTEKVQISHVVCHHIIHHLTTFLTWNRVAPPKVPRGCLSWLVPIFTVTETELVHNVGVDGVMVRSSDCDFWHEQKMLKQTGDSSPCSYWDFSRCAASSLLYCLSLGRLAECHIRGLGIVPWIVQGSSSNSNFQ